jgi:serine/threonine protein kinase
MNIGPYRIVRKLGEGGMSNVFLTEDVRTGKFVALKLLAPRVVADEIYRLRLLREAHVISSVQHRNIAAVYEADQFQDQPYIAMEYVEGETVSDRLVAGPLPIDHAVWIAAETANALAAAHKGGIVHRDVKPSNIIIQPSGHIKVMDFGLAKFEELEGYAEDEATGAMRNLTARGTILGTVNYMCPEQAKGESCDFRADIYSLGVVLFEMLTGRAPFTGAYAFAVLKLIINEMPAPISTLRADVPPELEAIAAQAMSKLPVDRFQSAAAMEAALRALLPAQT